MKQVLLFDVQWIYRRCLHSSPKQTCQNGSLSIITSRSPGRKVKMTIFLWGSFGRPCKRVLMTFGSGTKCVRVRHRIVDRDGFRIIRDRVAVDEGGVVSERPYKAWWVVDVVCWFQGLEICFCFVTNWEAINLLLKYTNMYTVLLSAMGYFTAYVQHW